jgi:hypothetical protein
MAGLRWDHLEKVPAEPISEQASLAWQMMKATTLQMGFGRYAQLSSQPVSDSCVPPEIGPPLVLASIDTISNHFVVAVEHQWGENLRLRMEGFARQSHDLFGERVTSSKGCPIVTSHNPLDLPDRSYTRGGEVVLQRRSANRLSGWIGYTVNYAREHVPVTLGDGSQIMVSAPDIEDQRHTLNSFATYRLTPTINLSGKFLFGSGMPLTSLDFTVVGNTLISVAPSRERLGNYQRLDLRLDKTFMFKSWKMSVFGEVLNVTDHNNPRFITLNFDPTTNRSSAVTERGLPLTPTVGFSFEF